MPCLCCPKDQHVFTEVQASLHCLKCQHLSPICPTAPRFPPPLPCLPSSSSPWAPLQTLGLVSSNGIGLQGEGQIRGDVPSRVYPVPAHSSQPRTVIQYAEPCGDTEAGSRLHIRGRQGSSLRATRARQPNVKEHLRGHSRRASQDEKEPGSGRYGQAEGGREGWAGGDGRGCAQGGGRCRLGGPGQTSLVTPALRKDLSPGSKAVWGRARVHPNSPENGTQLSLNIQGNGGPGREGTDHLPGFRQRVLPGGTGGLHRGDTPHREMDARALRCCLWGGHPLCPWLGQGLLSIPQAQAPGLTLVSSSLWQAHEQRGQGCSHLT